MMDVSATVDLNLNALTEPDRDKRAALIEKAWAEDGSLTDPPLVGVGYQGLHHFADTVCEHYADLAKLTWSEAEQHLAETTAEVLGTDAGTGRWGRDLVYSRSFTIAGGTTQVNKNIIAQRILGLPRSS